MNQKIITYSVAVAAFFIVCILAYFAFAPVKNGATPTPTPPTTNTNPSITGSQQIFNPNKLPTTKSITIPTSQGGVTTNNFFNFPIVTLDSGQQVMYIKTTSLYQVSYVFNGNYFALQLAAPKETTRKEAEGVLQSTLGINAIDTCKLKVVWTIGGPTGPSFPPDMPLSFCSGGLPLE